MEVAGGGVFERVRRERVAVPTEAVLLCACPRAGAGMVSRGSTRMTNAVCLSSSGTHHDQGDGMWREGTRAGSVAVSAITAIPFTGLIDASCKFTVYSHGLVQMVQYGPI
jgi:hypothetical protein